MTNTPDLNDIQSISASFGETYVTAKEGDSKLKTAQKLLFKAMDHRLGQRRLARKSIDLSAVPEEDRIARIERYHPGWRLAGEIKDPRKIILEQDPTKLSDTYVNTEDGIVYGRDVTQAKTTTLDTERLQEEDPGLWEEVTEWPMPPWLLDLVMWTDPVEDPGDVVQSFFAERGEALEIERVVRDPSTWSDKQSAKLKKYLYPAPVSVKLRPPRAAKPEELEEE